jgi:hypothetical protein
MRFGAGPLELRIDDAWTHGLEPRQRRTVSLLTGPLLARYGYSDRAPNKSG